MKKNIEPGLFIVFEGLDGSGASIQASLLDGILSKEGYRVHLTKEPTNFLIGGLIRGFLTKEWKSSPECLQLLFAADRSQHVNKTIIPHLQAGRIVISDRYAFSSVAYGSLEVEDPKWLEKLNNRFILPDLTFLIKVRPKICALRMKESNYELELFREEQKLNKVWKTYEHLSKKYKNVYLIDGERNEMEIMKEILKIVKKSLGVVKEKGKSKKSKKKK